MGKSIRPGEYRHLISIEVNTVGRDAAVGGVTNSWAEFTTAWAKIDPLQGFEAQSSNKNKGRIRYLMTYLWQAGIHPGMRISWDSKYYDIEAVLSNNEADTVIMMNVTEIDDQS